ncbi:hypothetical protein [Microbispora sp. GKU 823]|uniref:hypothetical protein n=1 Tax=Microbispora sp. GKU 823 TaxID=1652100 RepID=UPI0009D35C27|nr:hypothetical protein [Microbispora sp. GKU 823]OPG08179.1 hypothetical protein B1L11_28840 [Microbispora sp. GKU 823]
MLKRIHAAIAAVALGGAALVALPATAGAATAAGPSDLTVSPSPVVVAGGAGTTATFTYKASEKGAARLVDRDGRIVTLDPAPATSGPAGSGAYTARYGFTFRDEPGVWKLQVRADGGVATKEFQVHWTTDLDFDAAPDVVDRGDRIRLTGALTYRDGGGRQAYDGQRVYLAFKPVGGSYSRVGSVTTDRNGRFSVDERAVRSGWWRAEFEGASDAEPATSDSDRVDVRAQDSRTRITGFDASPEPVDAGDALRLRGRLEISGFAGWSGYPGRQVKILFKPAGGYRWQYVTSDWTDSAGRFWADVTARTSGWWRAEFDGAGGAGYSASATDYVTVRVPRPTPPPTPAPKADTRVVQFNAAPEPVRYHRYLTFRGQLQAWDDGWEGYGHQRVTVWFKKAGGSWHYVKTLWTNSTGRFWGKTKASASGYWRVVFAGNGEADRSTSRSDWVRVKR